MIPEVLGYWLGLLLFGVLCIVLAGNHAASSAALTFGSGVAEWRVMTPLLMVGFLVGGLSSGIFGSYSTILPVHEVIVGKVIDVAVMDTAVMTLLWTVLMMLTAVFFGIPLPGAIMISCAISGGLASSGLQINTMGFLQLLGANIALVITTILLTMLVGYGLERIIINSADPLEKSLHLLPVFFTVVIPVHVAIFICGFAYTFNVVTTLKSILILGGIVFTINSVFTYFLAKMYLVNRTKRHVFALHPQHVQEYGNGTRQSFAENLAERGLVVGRSSPTPSIGSKESNNALRSARAEESMVFVLLALATASAGVQGALDVGLLCAVWRMMGGQWADTSGALIMTIFLGLLGVFLMAQRSTEPMAKDLLGDNLTPMLAAAVELSSILPVLILSLCGFPISPILGKLPALLILSFMRGKKIDRKVMFRLMGSLFGSPIGCTLLTAGCSYLLSLGNTPGNSLDVPPVTGGGGKKDVKA